MRTISFGARFKKDYKREKRGAHGKFVDAALKTTTDILRSDELLPPRYVDHALVGKWLGDRDCHLKSDLILIYRKPDQTTLELVRLGSHSQLSL